MFGIKLEKETLLIIYKLLGDILFLLLGFFLLSLIADGVITGIVTEHISFLKITLLIFIVLGMLYGIGSLADVKSENNQIISNKRTALFLAVFGGLLIFNSLIKLNIFLALFILSFAIALGYFLFKNTFENY